MRWRDVCVHAKEQHGELRRTTLLHYILQIHTDIILPEGRLYESQLFPSTHPPNLHHERVREEIHFLLIFQSIKPA